MIFSFSKETFDTSFFPLNFSDRTRTYEVDFQGVVHNAQYILWFEKGRVEYLRHIGAKFDADLFVKHDKFMVARQEINYRNPIRFDCDFETLTRVAIVKNTSIVFEHLIVSGDKLIADSKAVMVYLDPETNEPTRLPDSYRESIKHLDKSAVFVA